MAYKTSFQVAWVIMGPERAQWECGGWAGTWGLGRVGFGKEGRLGRQGPEAVAALREAGAVPRDARAAGPRQAKQRPRAHTQSMSELLSEVPPPHNKQLPLDPLEL